MFIRTDKYAAKIHLNPNYAINIPSSEELDVKTIFPDNDILSSF